MIALFIELLNYVSIDPFVNFPEKINRVFL